jgi:sec-independent protein translocase protein TatA
MLTQMIDLGTNLPFAYFTSTQDWLIIGVIALVLFGGAKIPQLAKGLGEGIREFKKSVNDEEPETAAKPKTEA